MMTEMSEEGGFADAGLAADFDRNAGVDRGDGRRELRQTAHQSSNRPGAEQDRGHARTEVRAFTPCGLANDGATRLADVQDEAPHRDAYRRTVIRETEAHVCSYRMIRRRR